MSSVAMGSASDSSPLWVLVILMFLVAVLIYSWYRIVFNSGYVEGLAHGKRIFDEYVRRLGGKP